MAARQRARPGSCQVSGAGSQAVAGRVRKIGQPISVRQGGGPVILLVAENLATYTSFRTAARALDAVAWRWTCSHAAAEPGTSGGTG